MSKKGGGGGGGRRETTADWAALHSGESKSHSHPQSQSHSKDVAMLTINNPSALRPNPNESSFDSLLFLLSFCSFFSIYFFLFILIDR